MSDEQKLIDMYHHALEKGNDEDIIATSLVLAQHYYDNKDIEKAKHHLNLIKKKDNSIENLHLYLGLIALYENSLEKAKSEFKLELKYNPQNTFAKNLLNKVTISSNFPYATLFLTILFVLIFLFFYPEMSFSQTLLYGISQQHFTLFSSITSLFSHLNITHLILNSLLLLSLGAIVERHIGTLQFTLFFIITGLFSNISQVYLTTTNSIVIGASGAIFGIMGILLMQQPLLKLRLFGIIKIPVIILYGTLFSLSILFTKYLFGSAELSHMIGLFIGIFYAGIRYHETISVFYHWILITFGFYFVILLPQSFLLNTVNTYTFITLSLLFLTGILMIVYSYIKLKQLSTITYVGGSEE